MKIFLLAFLVCYFSASTSATDPLLISEEMSSRFFFNDEGFLIYKNEAGESKPVNSKKMEILLRDPNLKSELDKLVGAKALACLNSYEGSGVLNRSLISFCKLLDNFKEYSQTEAEKELKLRCIKSLIEKSDIDLGAFEDFRVNHLEEFFLENCKPDKEISLLAEELKRNPLHRANAKPVTPSYVATGDDFNSLLKGNNFSTLLEKVKKEPKILTKNYCLLSSQFKERDSSEFRNFLNKSFKLIASKKFTPLAKQGSCFHELINGLFLNPKKEKKYLSNFFMSKEPSDSWNRVAMEEHIRGTVIPESCRLRDTLTLSTGINIFGRVYREEISRDFSSNFANTFRRFTQFQADIFNSDNVARYTTCKKLKKEATSGEPKEKYIARQEVCRGYPETYELEVKGFLIGRDSLLEVFDDYEKSSKERLDSLEILYQEYNIPDNEEDYLKSIVSITDPLPESLKNHPVIAEMNELILKSNPNAVKDLALKRNKVIKELLSKTLEKSKANEVHLKKLGVSLKSEGTEKGLFSEIGNILEKIAKEVDRVASRVGDEVSRFADDVADEVSRFAKRIDAEASRMNKDLAKAWNGIKEFGESIRIDGRDPFKWFQDTLIEGVEYIFCPKSKGSGKGWCVEAGIQCTQSSGGTSCSATDSGGNPSGVRASEDPLIGQEEIDWLKKVELQDFNRSLDGIVDEGLIRLFESNYSEARALAERGRGEIVLPRDPVVRAEFLARIEALRSFENILLNARGESRSVEISDWQNALSLADNAEQITKMYNEMDEAIAIDSMGIGPSSPFAPYWKEFISTNDPRVRAEIIAKIALSLGLEVAGGKVLGIGSKALARAIKNSAFGVKVGGILRAMSGLEDSISPDKFVESLREIGIKTIEGVERLQRAGGKAGGTFCFVSGTLVQTSLGLRPIEDVKKNDFVLSYNFLKEKEEFRRVESTSTSFTKKLFQIKVKEDVIKSTGSHPFWISKENNWINAEDLAAGMELTLPDGAQAKIINVKEVNSVKRVYNFEVKGNHNYFIGKGGYLVHNGVSDIEVKEFSNALAEAMKILEKEGFKAEVPKIGKFGPNKGKPIGMQNADGSIGYRIEHDNRSGAHINIWSKKNKNIPKHIKWSTGSEKTVNKIVKKYLWCK